MARAEPIDPHYRPKSISAKSFEILLAMIQLLIPQNLGDNFIDIASVIDTRRFRHEGDGWRYASLPPDGTALAMGLDLIEKESHDRYHDHFTSLKSYEQISLMQDLQKGLFCWKNMDGKRWFEDLLAESTEIYVSHPDTLGAMGYDGIAFLPDPE